jgi:hypothetical protein
MEMPIDRTLAIQCKFVGQYQATGPGGPGLYGAMTYTQLLEGTDPPMPGVVQTTGEIDIYQAPPVDPTKYNRPVDMLLTLDPTSYCVLQDGRSVPVAWPPMVMNVYPSLSAVVVLNAPPSQGGTPVPESEATVSWAPGLVGHTLLIDDKDETKDYYYMPAVIVPDAENYFISCDPPIRNRAGG